MVSHAQIKVLMEKKQVAHTALKKNIIKNYLLLMRHISLLEFQTIPISQKHRMAEVGRCQGLTG